MTVYKFTCTDEQDFLIKCKIAKASDGRLRDGRYKRWFMPDWNLTGPNNVWIVEESGNLSCFNPSYANDCFSYAIGIDCIESINLGRL